MTLKLTLTLKIKILLQINHSNIEQNVLGLSHFVLVKNSIFSFRFEIDALNLQIPLNHQTKARIRFFSQHYIETIALLSNSFW